nr:hypothetical protein [Tanacetum cinerariifolium]
EAASTSHLPSSQLPSASRREDRPEVTLPPRKRLDIALGARYEVGESSSAAAARPAGGFRADYGLVATGAPVSTNTELDGYVREFETRVRQDMDEIYMRLDDEQIERQLLAGWLNILFRDRRAHAYTRQLMEVEERMRSTETSESMTALQGQITALQGQVTALQAQIATLQGQQGLTRDPIQPEPVEEASVIYGRMKQMAPRRTTRSTADQETVNATTVTNALLQTMIDQGVTIALAARDALRSTNGDDSHNSGTGVRRTERAARECTYTDFLKCQPLHFKDTKGVASLSQWCERMESVFHISNCTAENHVKFATCTLHSVALTWWDTHVQTVGHEAAYGMSWKTLMKMTTDKYCPRNEIRKLEMEIWELKAPPSPDYMPGLEEPEQAPPSLDYIPGPEHVDDEIVAEDQPYAEDASPIAQSPEYVPESDFEMHPEDDDDEDPKEDPVDYPADGGDDGDDEEESSEDEEDDEMDVEADEEEEEDEHPSPADSTSESRTALQGQITALQGQVTALQTQGTTLQGQQGLAGDPTQLELPEEAGGSA